MNSICTVNFFRTTDTTDTTDTTIWKPGLNVRIVMICKRSVCLLFVSLGSRILLRCMDQCQILTIYLSVKTDIFKRMTVEDLFLSGICSNFYLFSYRISQSTEKVIQPSDAKQNGAAMALKDC